MGFRVGLLDRGGAHMRVNLGRDKTLVAEHFLDAANVCASIQQMRSKTVPERVGRRPSI